MAGAEAGAAAPDRPTSCEPPVDGGTRRPKGAWLPLKGRDRLRTPRTTCEIDGGRATIRLRRISRGRVMG